MEKAKEPNRLKNAKENVERKPLLKLKTAPPPPVRQTLTSYKRMLKANPLLKYEKAGIDIDELFKSRGNGSNMGTISDMAAFKASCTLEGRSEFKKPVMRTQSLKLPKSNGVDIGGKKLRIISGNQPLTNSFKNSPTKNRSLLTEKHLPRPKTQGTSKYLFGNRPEQKKPITEIKAKVNSFPKHYPLVPKPSTSTTKNPDIQCPPKKKVSTLRRSLSSGHIQSKKGKSFNPKKAYTKSNQSQSHENISVHQRNAPFLCSPVREETTEPKSLVFKTPSAYERRSICHFTPRSVRKSSLFQTSTPAPVELQRLQERLNKWLKSRGKPLASFHHLRCFGISLVKTATSSPPFDDDNKENVEFINEKSESYEDLKIISVPKIKESDLPNKNDIPEQELAKVAKEAMAELQKLIEEDYPRAQCLGWLELIREKYTKAVDEPEYWECRAAIEQSLGNVGNAVEFYKTAIIQGAEVTTVDKSLDQLLKKFSLLNISPRQSEQNMVDGTKERIVREARTVFKSTIIQFAIQERKLKKKNDEDVQVSKKLVATPVRRSTRMSRSAYVSTPGIKLCTSLKEINLSTEEINFKNNKALC